MQVLRGVGLAVALALCGCTGDPAPPPAPGSISSGPPTTTTPAVPVLERTALAGGMTEVVADPAFLAALDRLGLVPRVTGEAGYAAADGTFSFPVTGGEVAVDAEGDLAGEVRHAGSGLLLTSGTSTVALDDLVLDADASLVSATVSVDGAAATEDAPVLAVDPAGLQVARRGTPDGAPVLTGLRLGLTAQGAELLNAAFAPEGFAPDAPVGAGTLTLEPVRG